MEGFDDIAQDIREDIPKARPDWAFFFDVDGTLIDIAPTPDAAHATGGTVQLLGRLDRAYGGAVALVSGRPIADLDRIFAPLRLACAGLHGIERRSADGTHVRRIASGGAVAHARASLAGIEGRLPGILVEDKDETIAIHYRQAPQHENAVLEETGKIVADARGDLELLPGKMLAEIRPPGLDKGAAILAFMDEPPFHGRIPVFVGDDVTDEDGFAAVNELGGHSIRIGRERIGCARHRLDDVAQLLAWMENVAQDGTSA